jgi:hypothetical protein
MSNEGTPKPGRTVPPDDAARLVETLRTKLVGKIDTSMAANVPLACRFMGAQTPGLSLNARLNGEMEVFLYFENLNEVRKSTIASLAAYLSVKEPWEDYDICVFDDRFKWFIGVTHNDAIIAIGIENLVGD